MFVVVDVVKLSRDEVGLKEESTKERSIGMWNDATVPAEVIQFNSQLIALFQVEDSCLEHTVERSDESAIVLHVNWPASV